MTKVTCADCEGFGYFEEGDIVDGEELQEDQDCETCGGDGTIEE